MIGWTEILIIFLVVFLLFGAKRIPEIARSLGQATREFKKAKDEIVAEVNTPTKPAEKPAAGADADAGDGEDGKDA